MHQALPMVDAEVKSNGKMCNTFALLSHIFLPRWLLSFNLDWFCEFKKICSHSLSEAATIFSYYFQNFSKLVPTNQRKRYKKENSFSPLVFLISLKRKWMIPRSRWRWSGFIAHVRSRVHQYYSESAKLSRNGFKTVFTRIGNLFKGSTCYCFLLWVHHISYKCSWVILTENFLG